MSPNGPSPETLRQPALVEEDFAATLPEVMGFALQVSDGPFSFTALRRHLRERGIDMPPAGQEGNELFTEMRSVIAGALEQAGIAHEWQTTAPAGEWDKKRRYGLTIAPPPSPDTELPDPGQYYLDQLATTGAAPEPAGLPVPPETPDVDRSVVVPDAVAVPDDTEASDAIETLMRALFAHAPDALATRTELDRWLYTAGVTKNAERRDIVRRALDSSVLHRHRHGGTSYFGFHSAEAPAALPESMPEATPAEPRQFTADELRIAERAMLLIAASPQKGFTTAKEIADSLRQGTDIRQHDVKRVVKALVANGVLRVQSQTARTAGKPRLRFGQAEYRTWWNSDRRGLLDLIAATVLITD